MFRVLLHLDWQLPSIRSACSPRQQGLTAACLAVDRAALNSCSDALPCTACTARSALVSVKISFSYMNPFVYVGAVCYYCVLLLLLASGKLPPR